MNTKAQRRQLVAGNWKLHKTVGESLALVRELRQRMAGPRECEVVVAPVFTALHAVGAALDGARIGLSAQDCYWEEKGAFTGQVAPSLLKDVGCTYCIVGHSERRQLFGETDDGVKRKAAALLGAGLTPIVCVGETLAERERGETLRVVLGQVGAALAGLSAAEMGRLVIAYEPVWAIGTGRNASPADAQEVHGAIRGALAKLADAPTAAKIRVLYGGSVKPDNAKALLSQQDIDGALVGGASLTADAFVPIVEASGASS